MMRTYLGLLGTFMTSRRFNMDFSSAAMTRSILSSLSPIFLEKRLFELAKTKRGENSASSRRVWWDQTVLERCWVSTKRLGHA